MRRRDALRTLAVVPAATWLAACGDNVEAGAIEVASAVFEIAPDRFLVWAWAAASDTAVVRVTGPDGRTTSHDLSLHDDSGIGVIDITDLTPDQRYSVMIEFEAGDVSGPHAVHTAPAAGDAVPVRLAVSADYDPLAKQFASRVLDGVTQRAPDFFVSIGDFPYTDDKPLPLTVDEFRRRHVTARSHPPLHALHLACGCYSIYDDHEFTNNWDAACAAADPKRLAMALQVWDEFFPLRDAAPDVRYRNWRWGALVECFLLDCRRFRSADDAPNDARKTMLGAPQLAWFLAALAASTATFKIIFTSIPLDYTAHNADDWTSFACERDAIFEHLVSSGISGVLFLSGDQHWFASQSHRYGIREIQVGPLRRGLGSPPPPVPAVKFRYVGFNAAVIDVAADRVTVSGVGPDATVFYTETLTLAELTPSRLPPR